MFLLPWLVGFFGLTLIPMIASLYFSFTQYDMLTPAIPVGLKNYESLFADGRFINSLKVTFKYVIVSVPLQLAFALLVALMLKKNRRGVKVYRAMYYLPSLFGGSVAVSILWRQLFNKEGVFNQILAVFGIEGKNWIATPSSALNTLIVLAVWQFGASMVIFLASLKQIPEDYYEAATLDGAGKIAQFFRITLPLLTPMVFSISSCRLLTLSSRLTPRILSAMVPADRWIPPCSIHCICILRHLTTSRWDMHPRWPGYCFLLLQL